MLDFKLFVLSFFVCLFERATKKKKSLVFVSAELSKPSLYGKII